MEQARLAAEYCRVTFEFQLRKALKTVSHRVIAATPPLSPTIPFDILGQPLENRFDRFFVVVNHSRHTSPSPPFIEKAVFRNGANINENCFDLNDFRASYPFQRDFFSTQLPGQERSRDDRHKCVMYIFTYGEREREKEDKNTGTQHTA